MENPERAISATFRKEKIRRVAGDLEVIDLVPETLKDEVPILIIPGWGETPATHKDTLNTIANLGRRAIAIKVSRWGGVETQDRYQQSEYNKARALIDTLNKKEIKTADIIAHSEGALSAIIAAEILAEERQPKRIRSIVFVEPVGLIGKDKLRDLIGRWSSMMGKDGVRFFKGSWKEKGNMSRAFIEAVKYASPNPSKTLAEGNTIAAADIYESLDHLRELGIKTSIIHAVDDTILPMAKV